MSKIYEMTVAREHVMEKIQVDNVNVAREIFKEKIANKDNSIRARTVEGHKVTAEKFYGEDPDWWAMDEEWNYTEKDINAPNESWDIYMIDTTTKAKTLVDSCRSENEAIDWTVFHAEHDAKFGTKYIYTYEHVCC